MRREKARLRAARFRQRLCEAWPRPSRDRRAEPVIYDDARG